MSWSSGLEGNEYRLRAVACATHVKREPGLATGLPCLACELSVRWNLDSHDVLEHAVEAAEDGELVHLLRNLLQRFQLLQTQQRRVLVHETRRVQQRARCRGLFTTLDQVRLRDLLRLHDAVENFLHLTRQDHVLDADARELDAVLLD